MIPLGGFPSLPLPWIFIHDLAFIPGGVSELAQEICLVGEYINTLY